MSRVSTPAATVSSSAEPSAARAWVRLPLLALWTCTGFVLCAGGTVLLFPLPRGRRAARRVAFRVWARGVLRLLAVRTVVEGEPPASPFYLVSNHLGYLDIVVYAALSPARFVAKREVRGWPVVGFLAALVGTIFVDRTSKRDAVRAVDELGGALRAGDDVVVFAEATSSAGSRVLPFRPALLEAAARAARPVHYASLSYRTPPGSPPAHLAVCWWGDMTFAAHLFHLSRLPWIEATVRHGPRPIAERDRKRLAERLHQAVSSQFTPVVTEPG